MGLNFFWLVYLRTILKFNFILFIPGNIKGSQANSADPAQMPHNVASDQSLHCLLTGFSIKNRTKATE